MALVHQGLSQGRAILKASGIKYAEEFPSSLTPTELADLQEAYGPDVESKAKKGVFPPELRPTDLSMAWVTPTWLLRKLPEPVRPNLRTRSAVVPERPTIGRTGHFPRRDGIPTTAAGYFDQSNLSRGSPASLDRVTCQLLT